MYNVGIISADNKVEDCTYVDALEESECTVHYLQDKQKWLVSVEQLDALIIEETEMDNQIGKICESIITIREQSSALIWIMSKNADKSTRIVYMKLGADGIINKTIDSDELSLFIQNNLNRYVKSATENNFSPDRSFKGKNVGKKKKIELIPSNFSVLLSGKIEVSLTQLEFRTIELLSNHPSQALTYEEIYQYVWNGSARDKRYRVANIIYHLRQKIANGDSSTQYIKTIRSKGYMLLT
ncbi:response regulator transcription factor [Enterococcus plantarum]|uniref:response regulator transcription factor n=1 Tax=Enterococcus plantarum TaxID=1077675 RepID=UPI001A905A0C|nr:winged helix-turn-helix domain-containing protein [Enterococcus plantarum]MBO0466863.1 response regulator transcription factor [Enterococcus plantarum]